MRMRCAVQPLLPGNRTRNATLHFVHDAAPIALCLRRNDVRRMQTTQHPLIVAHPFFPAFHRPGCVPDHAMRVSRDTHQYWVSSRQEKDENTERGGEGQGRRGVGWGGEQREAARALAGIQRTQGKEQGEPGWRQDTKEQTERPEGGWDRRRVAGMRRTRIQNTERLQPRRESPGAAQGRSYRELSRKQREGAWVHAQQVRGPTSHTTEWGRDPAGEGTWDPARGWTSAFVRRGMGVQWVPAVSINVPQVPDQWHRQAKSKITTTCGTAKRGHSGNLCHWSGNCGAAAIAWSAESLPMSPSPAMSTLDPPPLEGLYCSETQSDVSCSWGRGCQGSVRDAASRRHRVTQSASGASGFHVGDVRGCCLTSASNLTSNPMVVFWTSPQTTTSCHPVWRPLRAKAPPCLKAGSHSVRRFNVSEQFSVAVRSVGAPIAEQWLSSTWLAQHEMQSTSHGRGLCLRLNPWWLNMCAFDTSAVLQFAPSTWMLMPVLSLTSMVRASCTRHQLNWTGTQLVNPPMRNRVPLGRSISHLIHTWTNGWVLSSSLLPVLCHTRLHAQRPVYEDCDTETWSVHWISGPRLSPPVWTRPSWCSRCNPPLPPSLPLVASGASAPRCSAGEVTEILISARPVPPSPVTPSRSWRNAHASSSQGAGPAEGKRRARGRRRGTRSRGNGGG